MIRILFPLFVLAVLVAADKPKDDASKKDLDQMQGDWVCESYTIDGQNLPAEDAQALFRTIKGNDYTVSRFSKVRGKGTFTLDATKKPKTIDITPANLPKGAKPILGIYEINGDTLKMCYGRPGTDRPTEFASKEESGLTLMVWKREEVIKQ